MSDRQLGADQAPRWIGLASAVIVAIGAFGPWLRGTVALLGELTNHGTDNPDGKIVLGIAVAAGLLVLGLFVGLNHASVPAVAALVFVAGIVAGIVDYRDALGRIDDAHAAGAIGSIGWGLYLVLIGSTLGAIAMTIEAVRRIRRSDTTERTDGARSLVPYAPRAERSPNERDDAVIVYILVGFVGFIALGALVAHL